jgi:DNA (cytosine-5)-methyltransferase 1
MSDALQQRTSVIALGDTPKGGRIYLQGKWLLKAGFETDAKFEADITPGRITLSLFADGTRRVSGKQNRSIPVIDIENLQVRDAFVNTPKLLVTVRDHTITITPAHTLILIRERKMTMTEGSLFSGGGFLTQAAASLGFTPRFGVEIEPDYAEIYEANHPSAAMFNCSVEEVPYESLRQYRPLGLLTMGIPCEPFSRSRHWDRGTDAEGKQIRRDRELPPEAHPNGDMVYWGLRAIEATNPSMILAENVPDFLKSSAFHIFHNVLTRLGYNVEGRIVDPLDYGGLTSRKRAIIIARTGAPVDWPAPALFSTRTMGDILEPSEAGEWFDESTKPWLFRHWRDQTAKGNGFASQQITVDSFSSGSITKRYFAGQGQNPVVKHPTLPDTFRWLSLAEVKRLHGIADNYFVGQTKTLAGEVIGQGVVVDTMRQILAANLN